MSFERKVLVGLGDGADIREYDVLQTQRDGAWVDFSTLRTRDEARTAMRYTVGQGLPADFAGLSFRIVEMGTCRVLLSRQD